MDQQPVIKPLQLRPEDEEDDTDDQQKYKHTFDTYKALSFLFKISGWIKRQTNNITPNKDSWCPVWDSNPGPTDYESAALTAVLTERFAWSIYSILDFEEPYWL